MKAKGGAGGASPGIGEELRKTHIQLIVLFSTLALALISNALFGDPRSGLNFLPVLFGLLVVLEIAYFVMAEVKEGAAKHGWKHEALDTVVALAIALAIWFGASFLLDTSTPVSAVVSCSMLPNLQRGDFVIVQGAPVRAHEISMTGAELAALNGPAAITYPGGEATISGSLFPYCVADRRPAVCGALINTPESVVEAKGPFTYRYERCSLAYSNGSLAHMPCLRSVEFHGTEYFTDFSNDVIVYQPRPEDAYASIGDIVHRAFFVIDANGSKYYLTRGDNNPLLDLQVYDYRYGAYNRPVPEDRVRGVVIGRVPILGYFKLFISGFLQEDPQCRTQLDFTEASEAA